MVTYRQTRVTNNNSRLNKNRYARMANGQCTGIKQDFCSTCFFLEFFSLFFLRIVTKQSIKPFWSYSYYCETFFILFIVQYFQSAQFAVAILLFMFTHLSFLFIFIQTQTLSISEKIERWKAGKVCYLCTDCE